MTKKVIGITAALVLFAALVLPLNAQWNQLLDEDFESAWSTTSPPAGWTIHYTGSVGNSDWHRANHQGSQTACIYWSPSETGTDELISPVLDCSGASEVWIVANHEYSHYSGAYTSQWLGSTDGGSTFPNVIYDYYQSTVYWTKDSIDISSWAAGESQVVINFYGDGYTWNMNYWYVDNVDVWALGGGPSKPPFVDTLFCEYFEGSWLPTGWTQIIYNTGVNYYPCTWYHGNYMAGMFHHGSWGAYIWWSYSYQNEWLKTFSVDLTGYDPEDSVDLTLHSAFYGGDNNTYICISTDGGATWVDTLVDLCTESPQYAWTYIDDYPNPLSYRISQYIGQTIMIGFNYWYMAPAAGRGVWSVDDVCVIASGGGGNGPGADSLDLAMMAIIRPKTEEVANVPFTPEILVTNNLDSTAHARISCKIKEIAGPTVYEDVLAVVPLEPGENDIYGFKDFTPEGGKEYNALFVLEHPDDINTDNDHLDKNFHATVGMDVTPFEIVLPADVQDGSFKPTAKYTENAGADTTEANLICEITESGTSVYKESVSHTFTANETWTENTFPTPGIESGTYTITFWAENPLDGSNISFPPISKIFEYTTSIAETPVPQRTSLEVLGHSVNFALSEASHVNIRVYDAAGKAVTTLVDGSRGPGSYTMNWNTSGVAAGVYFVRMITPEFNATCKVMILH
ncbi:T9SS type A sorting domain-containing protein [candidate division WOR-3 bacterium]|nr:T9SS type A sorting domain-containing protein [candidate division WOR-3 bacterium]